MRELVLILVVVGISIAGVPQPRIAMCGYVWFSLMRPDLLSYAPNRPYSQAIAAALLLGSLRCLPQIFSILKNPIVIGLVALQAVIAASVFTAVEPELSYDPWLLFLKMSFLIGLIPLLIQTREWVSVLIQAMAFSTGGLGLKYGLFSVITGGSRIGQGIAGSFFSDNNTLALAFVCGVPLCWFARDITKYKLLRWMFTAMAFFSVAAIVSSYSRGAALGLAVTILTIGAQSKHKLTVAALFVIMAAGAAAFVGQSYLDRLSTMSAPTEEASANNRIEYVFAAIEMWKDYPILGVGFGMNNQQKLLKNYTPNPSAQGNGQVVHNTYFQMLTDSGIFAFLIYIALLFGTIRWLGKSAASHRKRQTGLDAYPMAIRAALIGYAVGSTFLSRVHFDLVYILLMAAASWYICEKGAAQAAMQQPASWPVRSNPLANQVASRQF